MSKVTRTFGLFFIATLFFLNLSIVNYGLFLNSQIQPGQIENSDSYHSTQNFDLCSLNRTEKQPVFSVKNLPVSNLKNHPNDLHGNFLYTEERISGINSCYLSYTVTLDPSLSNREIVFPFHYFW
jgi:hypothetical protein